MFLYSANKLNADNTANAFDLKCLSLNVRGLNKSIKRRTVFRWLHNQNHHVMLLQESYCSKELETIWENEWGSKAFFSHGTNQSKGVITLIKPSVNFKVEKAIPDKQGRFIILKLSLEEKVGKKTVFYEKWYDAGIIKISDFMLFDEQISHLAL